MTLHGEFWCAESSNLHNTAGKVAQGTESIKFNLKASRIELLTGREQHTDSLR